MCDATMKLRCRGGITTCSRCQFRFCNYHKPINNHGRFGGHVCVCDEGRKNAAYGANCTTSQLVLCPYCGQKLCSYHAPPNRDGVKGGHGGCSGPKCSTNIIHSANCSGITTTCDGCFDAYCEHHRKPGTSTSQLTGGHVCAALTNIGTGGYRGKNPQGPFDNNAVVYFQRTIKANTIRHQWVGVNWNGTMMHYEIAGECSGDAPNKIDIKTTPNGDPEQCISFGPLKCGKSHEDILRFKIAWLRKHPTYKLITDDCQTFTTDLLNFLGIANNRVPAGDASGLRWNNY